MKATKSAVAGRVLTLALAVCLCGTKPASAQDDRDYMRVIARPEMLIYAAEVSDALAATANRKYPQLEQTSSEGVRRAFCAHRGDTPDLMITRFEPDQDPGKFCLIEDPLLVLPFGRQVFVLYTAPGAPHYDLTLEQLFRAVARYLPRRDATDSDESGFELNPNKTWHDISPDLPKIPIRVIGPPRRAVQWLAVEDLLMRRACMKIPAIKALMRIDETKADQFCVLRRTDQVMVYVDSEAFQTNRSIVPKGSELAINELPSMQLMADAVMQPVDTVLPDEKSLSANLYPLGRPLVALVRIPRMDRIPNLRNFVMELVSSDAAGPSGYLRRDGLTPLPEELLRRSETRAEFSRPATSGQTDAGTSATGQPAN